MAVTFVQNGIPKDAGNGMLRWTLQGPSDARTISWPMVADGKRVFKFTGGYGVAEAGTWTLTEADSDKPGRLVLAGFSCGKSLD